MDMRWLKTDAARFRLVGVVNRLDRRDFHALRGETRLRRGALHLPARLQLRSDGKRQRSPRACRSTSTPSSTRRRTPMAAAPASPGAGRRSSTRTSTPAGWPAGRSTRRELTFKQLELNAQVVRFPSGQEPEFGGQAAYLMRIFGIDGDSDHRNAAGEHARRCAARRRCRAEGRARRLCRATMSRRSTPASTRSPTSSWRSKVISFSTFGSARLANHPFTPLFKPRRFRRRSTIRAAQACALAGSADRTAGQRHLPGLPPVRLDGRLPFHRPRRRRRPRRSTASRSASRRIFHAELPRRAAYLEAVVRDERAEPFPAAVLRAAGQLGRRRGRLRAGRHRHALHHAGRCRASSATTGSAARARSARRWRRRPDDRPAARAMPAAEGQRGDVFRPSLPDRRDRHQHRASPTTTRIQDHRPVRAPSPRRFRAPTIPAGRRASACRAASPIAQLQRQGPQPSPTSRPGKPMPHEICGLVGGKKFDICVATGNFDQCLGGAVNRGNRPACWRDAFLPRGLYVPVAAGRHAGQAQGQGHRLLLADLFRLPDAHRQPPDAAGRLRYAPRWAPDWTRRWTPPRSSGSVLEDTSRHRH